MDSKEKDLVREMIMKDDSIKKDLMDKINRSPVMNILYNRGGGLPNGDRIIGRDINGEIKKYVNDMRDISLSEMEDLINNMTLFIDINKGNHPEYIREAFKVPFKDRDLYSYLDRVTYFPPYTTNIDKHAVILYRFINSDGKEVVQEIIYDLLDVYHPFYVNAHGLVIKGLDHDHTDNKCLVEINNVLRRYNFQLILDPTPLGRNTKEIPSTIYLCYLGGTVRTTRPSKIYLQNEEVVFMLNWIRNPPFPCSDDDKLHNHVGFVMLFLY